MVYSWAFNMGVSAQVAGEEIERIEREQGEVTPRTVLDASREEGAPLHKCFEWDDTVAAEQYRLGQAGCIIRNLLVTVEDAVEEPVKAFVNVRSKAVKSEGSYINVTSALSNNETRNIVLSNALKELETFKRKYASLSELAEVMKVIDSLKIAS